MVVEDLVPVHNWYRLQGTLHVGPDSTARGDKIVQMMAFQ